MDKGKSFKTRDGSPEEGLMVIFAGPEYLERKEASGIKPSAVKGS